MRELVMYNRRSDGLFTKTRQAVPTFSEPRETHEVYSDREMFFGALRVFAPDETFALCWGVIMITTVVYQVLSVPYFLAFDSQDTYATLILDFVCTVVYFFDMVVTFNTSFYQKGILITTRKAIFIRYFKTWLILDVISSFPYSWLIQDPFDLTPDTHYKAPSLIKLINVSRILRTARLLRAAKIRQHVALLEQKMSSKLSILFTTVWLCLIMTSIAHWAACGFYYMSKLGEEVDSWVATFNMQNSSEFDRYITALYWAITTLTTTGYGDIVPVTTIERIYGVIIMIISAGVFSYLIGKVGTVIALLEKDSTEHKELIMDVTRYLKNSEVPENVTYRALRYLDYVHDTRNRRKVLDTSVLKQFSEPLKNEISDHIFGNILLRVPALNNFERDFISQLARGVKPEIFAQDDVLFEGNQLSSDMYFLEKGTIEIYHKTTAHTFAVLRVRRSQPGQHFGEISFFTSAPRSASARCLQFSEVLSLSRSCILDLTKLSPSANYTFQIIASKFIEKEYGELGIECYVCKNANHLAHQCSVAMLKVDKDPITQKWLRKRNVLNRAIQPGSEDMANFTRKVRRVHALRHYSMNNVKSQGWKRMKGWGYGLTKAVERTRESLVITNEQAKVIAMGQKDEMEFCPLSAGTSRPGIENSDGDRIRASSYRPTLTFDSDDEYSPPETPRRYSLIAGVKSYHLSDLYGRLNIGSVEQNEAISEDSEDQEDEQIDFLR